MKFAIILAVICSVGGGGSRDIQLADLIEEKLYNVGTKIYETLSNYFGISVKRKNLNFHLIMTDNIEKSFLIDFDNPEIIAECMEEIFIIIHGLLDGSDALWIHDLTKVLSARYEDCCVLLVDWSKYSFTIEALHASDIAGILLGRLISFAAIEYEIPIKNFIIIGHSIGAHAGGQASKVVLKITGNKIPLIVGLDPAGVNYNFRPDSKRLHRKDAEVVMVIHTDSLGLGVAKRIGTIDFYPNSGGYQPGCLGISRNKREHLIGSVECNHLRALEYFIEAVNVSGSFPARKCKTYAKYLNHECEENKIVCMGDLETKERGRFYLRTNSKKPFSRHEI